MRDPITSEPTSADPGHEPGDPPDRRGGSSQHVDRESAWSAPGTRTRSSTSLPPGDHTVFRCTLHGEIDFSCRDQLSEVARAFASSPCESARVDVSGVTFVDSTALALLLGMRSVATDRGGRVVLVAPGRRLRRLLAIAGVEQLFGVDDPSSN